MGIKKLSEEEDVGHSCLCYPIFMSIKEVRKKGNREITSMKNKKEDRLNKGKEK